MIFPPFSLLTGVLETNQSYVIFLLISVTCLVQSLPQGTNKRYFSRKWIVKLTRYLENGMLIYSCFIVLRVHFSFLSRCLKLFIINLMFILHYMRSFVAFYDVLLAFYVEFTFTCIVQMTNLVAFWESLSLTSENCFFFETG